MRIWDMGDEEPSDHPPIVDDDSILWIWMEVEPDYYAYVQQGVTINGNLGTGSRDLPWRDLLEEFGPVREVVCE